MSEKQMKILVIEDEEDTRLFLKDRLEMNGYEVDQARNGQEGLERVRESRPDLILLDVMLPKMNGYQVCRQLKQDEATRTLPIIILTAKAEESDQFWGKEIGCDDFVTKPFDLDELILKVARLLSGTA
ncbi:MAG: response regulator [Pseudomonadota bacterium]